MKNTSAGFPGRNTGAVPDHSALQARVDALNSRYRHHSATAVLQGALRDPEAGRIAMVSSFGAESVALLHLVAMVDRKTPVLFIDTQLLFAETLVYQQELAERLRLENLQVIHTDADTLAKRDPYGGLRLGDRDACCSLRKTEPLEKALDGYDGWITGRKRYQSASRANLQFFELEDATGRIKVNPLAHWGPTDVRDYMEANRLPKHPLVAKGYPSIGCAPCTSKVAPGEDPRAGRWRGEDKEECGIHFVNGRAIRPPASADQKTAGAKNEIQGETA
ncbi:phosphoadenylyl-sulfate reductase [Pelagimonas varians]|uniref:Adenosine 5'-phosphosulfate reductase n=1 Tax=Pelagimonas varians TaxID=696760 RepID=A0A238JT59_9RHOB|nr:phosphoadenylyl-sulfate reductase [Pelagimonas varians]PYG34674.1 phosphoadenylylsulfate reductase (thioredoxin) [Pelagimonas varians]SMX32936.1 Phosphoadenosine phosphosulfate reductase [Pelagimonas varians]